MIMSKRSESQRSTSTDSELILDLRIIYNRLHNLHILYNFNAIIVENEILISKPNSKNQFVESRYIIASLVLRCESIIKFYFQSYNEYNSYLNKAYEKYAESIFNDYENIYSNWEKDLQFTSEVVIQHLISLFDYISNLSLLTLIGTHKKNGKWKSHYLLKDNYKALWEKFQVIEKGYLDRLASIRGQIFHEGFINLKTNKRTSIKKKNISMNFFINQKFQRLLVKSEFIEYDSDVSIFNGFNLLITKIFKDIIELLEELKKCIIQRSKSRILKSGTEHPMKELGNIFNNVKELTDHLFYHQGYYWNDEKNYKNMNYFNRKINEQFQPFQIYSEDL